MNTPLIEACVDSYASCRAAYRGGADRLELCAHLVIGGTTPSTALFRQVQRDIPVKTNILIRPRFGDFLYSKEELEQMCEEIRTYRELGANGVVIGALTPDGDLDLDAMRRLMNCAGNMDVTLHRAFDMTRDPFAAMEDAIRLGCKTILTSGQQKDPLTGAELLRELFEAADGAAPCASLRGDRRRGAKLAGAAAFGAFAGLRTADQMVLFRKSRQRLGQL